MLGMKPMAAGKLPEARALGPTECLHYAMSLPTGVAITGCGSMALEEQAVAAGGAFGSLPAMRCDRRGLEPLGPPGMAG